MTTRNELMDLAKANPRPGTPELVTAITEASLQLNLATFQLDVRAKSAMFEKNNGSYQVVGSFLKEAADYEVAAAKLNTLFLTLACILQNGGVEISY